MIFEEQIMSKDKHLSIFSPQMETIVFTILQIFFTVLKIGEYSQILYSFCLGKIFSHMMCLDEPHVSKNIFDGL